MAIFNSYVSLPEGINKNKPNIGLFQAQAEGSVWCAHSLSHWSFTSQLFLCEEGWRLAAWPTPSILHVNDRMLLF